jgi:hypothetical protein
MSLPRDSTEDEATVDELVTPAVRFSTLSSIVVDMVG